MAIHNAASGPGEPAVPVEPSDEGAHPVEDLVSAAIFISLGVAAFVIALDYRTGTMHRMGPGIFPLLVSGLMVILGLMLGAQALVAWRLHRISAERPVLIPDFGAIRALLVTMLSLLAFAMLIRPAGMLIAIAVLVFIATRAQPGRPIINSLILSLALSILCALIFVYGIGLPISLWP